MKEIHATRQEYEKICEYCRKQGYKESPNMLLSEVSKGKPIYWYKMVYDEVVYGKPYVSLELKAGGLNQDGQRLAIHANLLYKINRNDGADYYVGDVIAVNKNITKLEDFQLLEQKVERIRELADEFKI